MDSRQCIRTLLTASTGKWLKELFSNFAKAVKLGPDPTYWQIAVHLPTGRCLSFTLIIP